MAQQLTCDICGAEPAVQMLTNLSDGTVLAIGGLCTALFYDQSLRIVTEAGDHQGPAGKCQACRRVHERITIPATASPPPAEDETPVGDSATPSDDDLVAP